MAHGLASKQGVHGIGYIINQQDMFTCETSDHAEFGTQSPLDTPSLSYSQGVSVEAGYMSNISTSYLFHTHL